MDKTELLNILIDKQLKDIDPNDRLSLNDIHRLTKYLRDNIFGEDCVEWGGYCERKTKRNRSCGIIFYFNGDKRALHRLLFTNYISPIPENTHIYFTCKNGPYCANVTHMFMKEYNNRKNKKKTKIDSSKDIFKINYDVEVQFD